MLKRCTKCRGKKEMVGMGSLPLTCPLCKGVGYERHEPKVAVEEEAKKDSVKDIVIGSVKGKSSKRKAAQK